jgi:hypothetical protein
MKKRSTHPYRKNIWLSIAVCRAFMLVLTSISLITFAKDPEYRGYSRKKVADAIREIPTCVEVGLCDPGKEHFILGSTHPRAISRLKIRGCTVKRLHKDETSLDCPKGTSLLNVREERVFKVQGLVSNAQIAANTVQSVGITGQGVRVAVLDTGIDTSHPELSNNIDTLISFNGDDGTDILGHGTHVAGIVAGQGVNIVTDSFGNPNRARGASPDVHLLVGKICNDFGWCSESNIIAGIEWAVSMGADVINLSLGAGLHLEHCDEDPLADKVNWAVAQGVVVVAGAGNSGDVGEGILAPACASKAVAVGAVDKNNVRPSWSSYGQAIDVVAPGVQVLSTYPCSALGICPDPGYLSANGTSMASPSVAGVAALIRGEHPELTPAEVVQTIKNTAQDLEGAGFDPLTGFGIVNVYDALLALQDRDGDGYSIPDDCNDTDPNINPLIVEVCNGIDDNCNGFIDEGFDSDGDSVTTCNGDCNDTSASVYPSANELCNGMDENCNGIIDEGFDNDNDGWTSCLGDCNDQDPSVFPGAQEQCNGIDDNCDSVVDDGFDQDGDAVTTCRGDCNDLDQSINPFAQELCNFIDENCNGIVDEGYDSDSDGFSVCEGDCDDTSVGIYPNAQEECNDIDDNCNGLIDENGVCPEPEPPLPPPVSSQSSSALPDIFIPSSISSSASSIPSTSASSSSQKSFVFSSIHALFPSSTSTSSISSIPSASSSSIFSIDPTGIAKEVDDEIEVDDDDEASPSVGDDDLHLRKRVAKEVDRAVKKIEETRKKLHKWERKEINTKAVRFILDQAQESLDLSQIYEDQDRLLHALFSARHSAFLANHARKGQYRLEKPLHGLRVIEEIKHAQKKLSKARDKVNTRLKDGYDVIFEQKLLTIAEEHLETARTSFTNKHFVIASLYAHQTVFAAHEAKSKRYVMYQEQSSASSEHSSDDDDSSSSMHKQELKKRSSSSSVSSSPRTFPWPFKWSFLKGETDDDDPTTPRLRGGASDDDKKKKDKERKRKKKDKDDRDDD